MSEELTIKEPFVLASPAEPFRMVISADGLQKRGRTHFGVFAPDPVGVINLDDSLVGVVGKAINAGRRVYIADYREDWFDAQEAAPSERAKEAEEIWKKLTRDVKDALSPDSPYKTVVVDTFTELWELARIAKFGKTTQILPRNYAPLNREIVQLFRKVNLTDKNLILINRMKEQWVNDANTGKWIRDSFSRIPYIVDVVLLFDRQDTPNNSPKFRIKIEDCRRRPEAIGKIIETPTFAKVGMEIFPESRLEDWS